MRTEKYLKRMVAALLALVLCFTMAETTSFAKSRAPKTRISDTALTMWTNDSSYIFVRNAPSKVTWKSSDKRIVKIEETFGKYSDEVSLKTGNKSGHCTITAKMKNKTYRCKITVKKGDIIKKYSGKKSKTVLEKITQKKTSIIIRYKMCVAAYKNCKCAPAGYGYGTRLEKYTNGKWTEIPMNVSMAFPCGDVLPGTDVVYPCEWITIPPKTSISKEIHLEDYYDISELTKGRYRLYVNVHYPHVKKSYVAFKLK